jgi:hypothetical protein
MDAPSSSRRRVAAIAFVAAALHGALDATFSATSLTTPPYLRLGDAPDVFRLVSPVAVSLAASVVSGIIAAIATSILGARPERRVALLGAVLAAFWMFSAALTRLAWLDTPLWPSVVGVLCGIPRGLAVAWGVSKLVPIPPPGITSAREGGA